MMVNHIHADARPIGHQLVPSVTHRSPRRAAPRPPRPSPSRAASAGRLEAAPPCPPPAGPMVMAMGPSLPRSPSLACLSSAKRWNRGVRIHWPLPSRYPDCVFLRSKTPAAASSSSTRPLPLAVSLTAAHHRRTRALALAAWPGRVCAHWGSWVGRFRAEITVLGAPLIDRLCASGGI